MLNSTTRMVTASELEQYDVLMEKGRTLEILNISTSEGSDGVNLQFADGGEGFYDTYRVVRIQVRSRHGESYPTGRVWAVVSQDYVDGPFDRFREFETLEAAQEQAKGQNEGRFMGGPAKVVYRDVPEWVEA